ncbi:unnamed protein product [Brassicogethes aeneus]|uniref:Voltage-dependent calcium channel gamma-5 subunit n=1 Tax=Brassicogethes aeneus TaxID=1431903 RepID=A0A9P0BEZ2_BRAAE|nr:unnamed protein product [Brassicogethes aeneus]
MNRGISRNTGSSSNENSLGPMEATLSCLWIVTPLFATISVLVVLVALITSQWLHTEEKMHNPSYNGTGEKDYLSKATMSGLWKICFTHPGGTIYECAKVDFFSKEEYTPDPNDSTLAIPYTVTKTVVFFLIASILLALGFCCCIFGQCVRNKSLYTFVSGVIFVITGLVMLFGLIMYISIFKAEIGGKLKPRSQLEPPVFIYSYGYSFLLYVVGLVSTKIAGICAIFLFIRKMQYDWARRYYEDLRKGNSTPILSNNCANHYDSTMYYPCRRHPQAYINSNSAIHFGRSPCGVNSE